MISKKHRYLVMLLLGLVAVWVGNYCLIVILQTDFQLRRFAPAVMASLFMVRGWRLRISNDALLAAASALQKDVENGKS